MMEMKRPKITYEENESGSFARFVVEPLERGFGTTLGNSLRRILLSALPGAAPVGIKIAGVDHEFSTIPGVRGNVTEIILNIKGLAIKIHGACPEKKVVQMPSYPLTDVQRQESYLKAEVLPFCNQDP